MNDISELFHRALKAHQSGAHHDAQHLYRKLLARKPRHADALNLLGVALCQSGQVEAGIECIEKSLAESREPQYLVNYGMALERIDRIDAAVEACREALERKPRYAEAHSLLGALLLKKGRFLDALAAYRTSVAINPNSAEAFQRIGSIYEELDRRDDAVAAYRVALDLDPESADALYRLGALLHDQGREEEAVQYFQRALSSKPEAFEVKWRLCFSRLKLGYSSTGEIEASRAAYERDLRALAEEAATKNPDELAAAAEMIGLGQPFYLPYQGRDDRALQDVYGRLVCRVMQTRYPQFSARPELPPLASDEKIRVGFVSGYFSRHSNWKIPIKGWVENLDRRRFETFGYHVGKRRDDATAEARRAFTSFVEGPMLVQQWAERIRQDRLHVLIYPETGMDQTAAKLAGLWLAPRQAVSWGHPNTSGLPTIDYFLTSDLMEPPDADSHYTEKLVRLPKLSVHYTAPDPPRIDVAREQLGLRRDAIAYWCCQSLFKYLPQYDDVFPRIAQQVKNCQFVFIRYKHGGRVTERLQERLMKAFARRGLSAKDHCLFLPQMDLVRFNGVARACDIFLDSIEWSACNSLLESLMFDLPPVVMKGSFMRGRHGAAILAMMDLEEHVADSLDEYVAFAVRLGANPEARRVLRNEIAQRKGALIGDLACIGGLESWLLSVASKAAGLHL